MNTGALKYVIEIYGETASQDAASGFINNGPGLLCTVRATRLHTSDREVWEAYAAKVRAVVNWKIRARAGIKTGMMVKCGEEWFEILDAQPLRGVPRYLLLKTARKEAK